MWEVSCEFVSIDMHAKWLADVSKEYENRVGAGQAHAPGKDHLPVQWCCAFLVYMQSNTADQKLLLCNMNELEGVSKHSRQQCCYQA